MILQRTLSFLILALLFLAAACSQGGSPGSAQGGNRAAALTSESIVVNESSMPSSMEAPILSSQRGVPPSSVAGKESRLDVVLDGTTIPLRNSGRVLLGDGLEVELFLDPYPPTTLRAWLDVYLTRDGKPVTNAEATIEYDMAYMSHGPFGGSARSLGDGHYLFTLDYIMYGAWGQFVTIRIEDKRHELPVVIVAYP